MATHSMIFVKRSQFHQQKHPPWTSLTWMGQWQNQDPHFLQCRTPANLTKAICNHPQRQLFANTLQKCLFFPLSYNLPARKERKKGKEVIPPCFAAVILPSEVEIDAVGTNHRRAVICLASEPTAPLLSCPRVVTALGTPDCEQCSELSTAAARRPRWLVVALASCISPGQ